MSAAQPLTPGLLAASAPSRSADARRQGDDGASFRDALDSASRSNDTGSNEGDAKAVTANDLPLQGGGASREDDADTSPDDASAARGDGQPAWGTDRAVVDISQMLAVLEGAPQNAGKMGNLTIAIERARPTGLMGPAFGGIGSGAAGGDLEKAASALVAAGALDANFASVAAGDRETSLFPTLGSQFPGAVGDKAEAAAIEGLLASEPTGDGLGSALTEAQGAGDGLGAGLVDVARARRDRVEVGEGIGSQLAGPANDRGQPADVDNLLDLLKVRPAEPGVSSNAGAAPVQEVTVAVLKRETHLALQRTPTEILSRLTQQPGGGMDAGADPANPAQARPSAVGPAVVQTASAVASGAAEAAQFARAAHHSGARVEGQTGGGHQDGQAVTASVGSARAAGQSEARDQAQSQGGSSQQGQGAAFALSLIDGKPRAAAVDTAVDFGSYVPVSDQIAAEVKAELAADGLGEYSSQGVLKVLKLDLKPANLGSVTVKIELKDNSIALHLETQQPETLVAIERDREALVDALSSAGYTVEGITAAPQADGPRSQAPAGLAANGTPLSASDQQQAGQGLANSSSGQREHGQQNGGNAGYGAAAEGKNDGTNGARRTADALYV